LLCNTAFFYFIRGMGEIPQQTLCDNFSCFKNPVVVFCACGKFAFPREIKK
jgi:hypothetical protein